MISHKFSSRVLFIGAVIYVAIVLTVVVSPRVSTTAQSGATDWQAMAAERGLTEAICRTAAMTYTPSGVMDEYVMFASAGQGGQVLAIGLPSMRLLRLISVFTPKSWQGYGYGAGNEVLEQGFIDGQEILWGDTHHPALSKTNGEYNGQWLFIGDKANGRVAVIDLRDFKTKQIVSNPAFLKNNSGAAFA